MKLFLQKCTAITVVFLSLIIALQAQNGPGGVGGHENDAQLIPGAPLNALWLKAGDLNLSNGDFVTSWMDVSGYNHSAVPGIAGKQGIYFQTDKINGLPWVKFVGENYLKVNNHQVLDGGEGFGIFVIAKRDSLNATKYGTHNNLVTKRAHWNAWSHVPPISMDPQGLQHAYELRWDRARGADEEFHVDTMAVTGFMNGNLPDGAGADVFPTIASTADINASYIISHVYSNHEDSYGSMVRINGTQTSRRAEGNPNPLKVGPVVESNKDLWLGGAQLDPPGAYGDNGTDACPTCAEESLLEGAMAEIIIYKGTLWHSHIFIIENYLSLKYGLPIDTAKYYHDDTYTHNMVGIGNEMGDDKKHIKSFSHAFGIEEWNETLDAPKEYIFAAHDGKSYEWTNEGLSNTNVQRWNRSWKIKKMGEVDARFSFNFIAAELNLVNSQVPKFRLAYKENPEDNFTILTDILATRELKTLYFIVPNDDIKDGYYTVVSGYDPNDTQVLNQDVFSNSMKIFPSPAQNQITVSFAGYSMGGVSIRIIDLTGREISRHYSSKSDDHFEQTLLIDHLNKGIYFVEVLVNDNKAVKRFIKK